MPFPFTDAAAALEYGEAVAAAIVRMKHGGRRDIAKRLARLLVPLLAEALDGAKLGAADAIVPVPLHPHKLRRRGFNQSLELIRAALTTLRRRWGESKANLPRLERRLLVRTRDTRELGHAGRTARLAEVAGAFSVSDPRRVRGRRFLVVDDVMTTGATLSECAHTLRACGATAVHVLALARAV